jgi:hypothetical protein
MSCSKEFTTVILLRVCDSDWPAIQIPYGAAPIDSDTHSPSALCFSSGHRFSFSNEIDGCLVNLTNPICAIVAIAILIAQIILV